MSKVFSQEEVEALREWVVDVGGDPGEYGLGPGPAQLPKKEMKGGSMKIVVVDSKEGVGGRLGVLVPESALWAFQVLCARADQKILVVKEEEDAS